MPVIIKPLAEMIADLDEETRKTEEWRKAQGLPKGSYEKASLRILDDFHRAFEIVVGKRGQGQ